MARTFVRLQDELPDVALGLILVNDGSAIEVESSAQDQILSVIPEARWISYKENRGKGYALRQGVMHATAPFIVYTDIDFPYTFESTKEMIQKLATGDYDALIGIRDHSYYNNLPPSRRRISRFLKMINAKVLGLKIADTQCGLKGFSTRLKSIFLATKIDRYLFDLEFIYLISQSSRFKIEPLQVTLREGVQFSKVKTSILFREARNFLSIWFGKSS